MIAVPRQLAIEVTTDEDEVVLSQTDRDGNEDTIFLAKDNVPALIAALQDAARG